MGREKEYILTTEPAEIERLRLQHHAWIEQAYALFARAGLCAGQAVLDLGCGPGFTSFELATVVGPRGRVIARDESARFLEGLAAERDRRGLRWIEPSLGRVEDLELPPESLDAAYARWLFCWLPDPLVVLQRVARALKPGGVLLLQEYVDWGAMQLFPRGPAFARGVEACLASWKAGGATIDFAAELPELAPRAGLVLEHLRPRARLARVGALEWRWLDQFFRLYLPKVVERGLLSARELAAWTEEWERRAAEGSSFVATPTVADAILRRR